MTAEQKQAVERLTKQLEAGPGFVIAFENRKALETLLQAVREMGEDTKRLDWLEANQKSIIHDCEAIYGAWCVGLDSERYETARKALDAAISQEGRP